MREATQQAEQAVQQPFAARIDALEKGVRELRGYAAATAGDFQQALALLEPSGTGLAPDVARFRLASVAAAQHIELVAISEFQSPLETADRRSQQITSELAALEAQKVDDQQITNVLAGFDELWQNHPRP